MPISPIARTAAALTLLAATAASSAPLYRVSATVTYADGPALNPIMLVEADKTAKMSLSGNPGYAWEVRISDIDSELNQATLDTDLQIAEGRFQPRLRVEIGKPATVEIGQLQLELLVQPEEQQPAL